MKKVAVLSGQLLPISQTFIREQVKSLQQWQPTLVGYSSVSNGLPLGVPHQFIFGESVSFVQRVLRRVCHVLNLANPLTVKILKALDPDLVHVHFGTSAVTYWPSVRKLGVPMLVTLHGYDITKYRERWERLPWWRQGRHYPRRLLRLAQAPSVTFIAVSDAIRERAIEYGIPANKVVTCYIGIDTEKFSVSPVPIIQRKKRVLFVGRLVEKKGAEYLIRAFASLGADVGDAELVIAGDGPLREQLERQAAASTLPITFLGAISSERVQEEIQQARVCCVPSVRAQNGDAEGLPTVIMEAQACGLPVITSANGGAREGIIDGETGFRFEEKDEATLANLLQGMLSDDELVTRLSCNASRFVKEKFDIRSCTQELERLYDTVLTTDANQPLATLGTTE